MEKGVSMWQPPGKEAAVEKKMEHPVAYPAPWDYRKPGILEELHVARAWSKKDKGEGTGLEWGAHQVPYKPCWET